MAQPNRQPVMDRGRYETYMEIMEAITAYKAALGCRHCSELDPVVLTFHHVDPSMKEANIGDIAFCTVDMEKVIEEMKKCHVVCDVCHRRIHEKRGKANKPYWAINKTAEQRLYNRFDLERNVA